MENLLKSALEGGQFVHTAELVMGRDHQVSEAEEFVRDASKDPNGIRIVSATDLPGGSPALPPEAYISTAIQLGLSPIVHLTGKDGNRAFVEARLHTMARMGAQNVLALTGDVQKPAFGGVSKPVFDLDSVLILQLVNKLRVGIEYNVGKRVVRTTPFDFYPGAVVNPFKVHEPDQMMQFYKLELKIASGANYIITQLGFDIRKLYELRQYMVREGLDQIPVIANVYVPTATIATFMQSGEVAGCTISDAFIKKLEGEKKPERIERAALMVAAVRDLGFAGAHIGGFNLKHADFMAIINRSKEIGTDWRKRVGELLFPYPGQFYLFPEGSDGLSKSDGDYLAPAMRPRKSFTLWSSQVFHNLVVEHDSPIGRALAPRLKDRNGAVKHSGFWHCMLAPSNAYRTLAFGCMMCGDCALDRTYYAACPMRKCYKQLRNGPCGGSRVDGTCEENEKQKCVWHQAYLNALAARADLREEYARTLLPPREWALDQTSPLSNRLTGNDGFVRRERIVVARKDKA
jgi:methylenetetrahydrofolate reductase (NADPH)